jgi:hypothetical protein
VESSLIKLVLTRQQVDCLISCLEGGGTCVHLKGHGDVDMAPGILLQLRKALELESLRREYERDPTTYIGR